MRKIFTQATLLLGALAFIAAPAHAQEIVHGLAGTVTAINPHAINIDTDDGSEGLFNILTQKNLELSFPRRVRALTVDAGSFHQANAQVIVFFFGDDAVRTAVALEDLGSAPLTKVQGTVVKFDKHQRQLILKDGSGKDINFHIDDKTIGDGLDGVGEAEKFHLDKGTQVRIVATTQNGALTALFIRALSL